MMGFFRKKKNNLPAKMMSPRDLEQNRLNMQSDIDKLDFEFAKKKKQAAIRSQKSGRGKQISNVVKEFGDALDFVDGSALSDPVGGGRTPSKKKSAIDDPFGKGFI